MYLKAIVFGYFAGRMSAGCSLLGAGCSLLGAGCEAWFAGCGV